MINARYFGGGQSIAQHLWTSNQCENGMMKADEGCGDEGDIVKNIVPRIVQFEQKAQTRQPTTNSTHPAISRNASSQSLLPPVIMMSRTLFLIAAVMCSCAHAFAPSASNIQSSSTALSMGLFDSFTKAFTNEEYGPPPDAVKATARHILVPTLEDANEVLGKVAAGETTFSGLASQYSTCPSKSRGGSLGSFSPGTM
eukprot:scaffold2019_cov134-Skeletonema_dohrnii-CCMP3373.AAC.1